MPGKLQLLEPAELPPGGVGWGQLGGRTGGRPAPRSFGYQNSGSRRLNEMFCQVQSSLFSFGKRSATVVPIAGFV